MTRLHETANRCAAIALRSGFDPATWDNFVAKIAFVCTEIDEARDAIRERPALSSYQEEMADTAIRLLATLSDVWGDTWADLVTGRNVQAAAVPQLEPFEVLIWPVLGHLMKAVECWRVADKAGAQSRLELALLQLFRLADALRVDLLVEIDAKCKKNEGRPRLHGKTNSAG